MEKLKEQTALATLGSKGVAEVDNIHIFSCQRNTSVPE